MTIGRCALDREASARDAMDAMDARSIVRAIVRDLSTSSVLGNDDRETSDIIRVVSETARKFKLALFRAFFGEGLEYIEGAGGGARGGRETGDGECVDAW